MWLAHFASPFLVKGYVPSDGLVPAWMLATEQDRTHGGNNLLSTMDKLLRNSFYKQCPRPPWRAAPASQPLQPNAARKVYQDDNPPGRPRGLPAPRSNHKHVFNMGYIHKINRALHFSLKFTMVKMLVGVARRQRTTGQCDHNEQVNCP